MSHIRGVKVESRIIVPILPRNYGARTSIPTFAWARYLTEVCRGGAPSINRRIPQLYG
jgi:hypothetical protein